MSPTHKLIRNINVNINFISLILSKPFLYKKSLKTETSIILTDLNNVFEGNSIFTERSKFCYTLQNVHRETLYVSIDN